MGWSGGRGGWKSAGFRRRASELRDWAFQRWRSIDGKLERAIENAREDGVRNDKSLHCRKNVTRVYQIKDRALGVFVGEVLTQKLRLLPCHATAPAKG